MLYQGVLTKMQTELSTPINYFLTLGQCVYSAPSIVTKKVEQ